MVSKRNVIKGLILIVIGTTLLLANYDVVNIDKIWPLALIIPGLALLFYSIRDKEPGLSIPGTVLTILGIFFLYETFNYWDNIDRLWPIFIIAPGLGFIAAYFIERLR